MYAAFFVGLIAVIFAYIARTQHYKYFLGIAFIIISCFLGIRYMWGNDMRGYYQNFLEWTSIPSISVFDLSRINFRDGSENGWVALNILCKPFGFIGLQIILVIIDNFIIYNFIKKYVNRKWYWLAVFIYCFNPYFMVLSSSMLRQFFAMCLFILAVEFIINRKFLLYTISILLISLFHHSALILLPVYFINKVNFKFKCKALFFIIPIIFLWFKIAPIVFQDVMSQLVTIDSFAYYSPYIHAELSTHQGTGFSLLFDVILISIMLIQNKNYPSTYRIFSLIFMLNLILRPFNAIAPGIARLGYYFQIFSIVSYPVLFETIKNDNRGFYLKLALLIVLILFTIYTFYAFFNNPVWIDNFYEYHTIFETLI